MRRRTTLIALPVAVAVVGAVAFVGYGAWSRAQPVEYSRGGAFVAEDALVPTDAPVPAASAAATRGAAPSTEAVRSPSVRPTTASRGRVVVPASPTADAPVAAPAAGPVRPATGTYRLAVTGTERATFGPVSVCSSDLPASSAWTVRRAQDGSYVVDHRWYPGSAGKHDERHIYRYDGDLVTLEYEQATVTCAGQRQSSEVEFSPAQLRIRGPLVVGASWSSTGGDAERTEAARSSVLRREQVTVGGRAVDTYVVQTRITISGDESGSRVQTWWWAPELALPVRVDEQIDAQRSGGAYRSDVSISVVGLPAA